MKSQEYNAMLQLGRHVLWASEVVFDGHTERDAAWQKSGNESDEAQRYYLCSHWQTLPPCRTKDNR